MSELHEMSELASAESVDPPPPERRRRASMSRSRGMGVVGFAVGAAGAAVLGSSPWIAGVVGFIVFAELPDVVYRVRARRGDTSPLLPDWDPSEAYLVTLRRWRRARPGSPDD
jgi:hypothetical protein